MDARQWLKSDEFNLVRILSLSIAITIASAVYLAGAIAGAIYLHEPTALKYAIASAGLAYVTNTMQMVFPLARGTITILLVLSIITGAIAGLILLAS